MALSGCIHVLQQERSIMQINYASCVIFFQDPFNLVLLGLTEFLSYYKKETERKKKDHCLILRDAL